MARPLLQSDRPGPLSIKLLNEDWEINDWSAIRRGQLSVIRARAGQELQVYGLTTLQPRPFPTRVRTQAPAFEGNCFLVSSLDSGSTNSLGGYFSSFQSAPSTARVTLWRWPDQRRALTLDFVKAGSGFCGMWMHLFDFKRSPEERVYFNAEPFLALTFWVCGEKEDERILLKISDAQRERREDAVAIGDLATFIPSGKFHSGWQQAVVPLAALPARLNRRELAGLVFGRLC